jgi:hypothetical protein
VSVLRLTRVGGGFDRVVELNRFLMAVQPFHSAGRLFGCVSAQIAPGVCLVMDSDNFPSDSVLLLTHSHFCRLSQEASDSADALPVNSLSHLQSF